MRAQHFEILVEEHSMGVFLQYLLPRMIGNDVTFEVYTFQGKSDLLAKLPSRLIGYANWLPVDWRIIVVMDRDNDDCFALKQHLEHLAVGSNLRTRKSHGSEWQIVFRLSIEELEAWYFGEWESVVRAYPRVSRKVASKSAYRDSDSIAGGTWEAFEREMQKAGYFVGGLRKIEAARAIGENFSCSCCSSKSFKQFNSVISEALAL